MRIVAVITDPGECKHSLEVNKILEWLKRNHAPPFDKVTKASYVVSQVLLFKNQSISL
ncbi:hypothetical protein ES703_48090 [subsurface metagenome]